MRRRSVHVYSLLFGGTAGGLLVNGRMLAGTILAAVTVGVAVSPDVGKRLRWFRARGWAALSVVYPVAPLKPGLAERKATGEKNAAIAIAALRAGIQHSSHVRLLLASGFRIIGPARFPGWLHDILSEVSPLRTLEILLLDPASSSAEARAAETMSGYGARHYQEGTKSVLWTLRQWKHDYALDIRVRLYTEEPIWQMVILPDDLWLLVAADGRSTDTSPFFVFRREQPYGLAWGLEAVWDRRWNLNADRDIDLDAIGPPDWDYVVEAD